jgi:hypothetical protein
MPSPQFGLEHWLLRAIPWIAEQSSIEMQQFDQASLWPDPSQWRVVRPFSLEWHRSPLSPSEQVVQLQRCSRFGVEEQLPPEEAWSQEDYLSVVAQ